MGNLIYIPLLEQDLVSYSDQELNGVLMRIIEDLKVAFSFKPIYIPQIIRGSHNDNTSSPQEFLDLGIIREKRSESNSITLLLDPNYEHFLPLILFREALYTFIPYRLISNIEIKLFINQMVEMYFADSPVLSQWQDIIHQQIITNDVLKGHYGRLEQFLTLQDPHDHETSGMIAFFLQFIRNHMSSIEQNSFNLYEEISKYSLYKLSRSLTNDDVLESIRILTAIFYEEKVYNSLAEYKNHFKQYKKDGYIKTDLSLRKFIENIRWMKSFTYIGPSYDVNWSMLGITPTLCVLTFNPLLPKHKIDIFLQNLPFFYQPNSSEYNFSIYAFGWFVIPEKYFSDLNKFLHYLQDAHYLVSYILIENKEKFNLLNLNYFRKQFHEKNGIIDRSHRDYDKKYEVEFYLKYRKKKQGIPSLSLLDFLLLDRVRYFSITGFSLEEKKKRVNLLKADFFNHILNHKNTIMHFKDYATKIHQDPKRRKLFIDLIENNNEQGFFYIYLFLKTLLKSLDTILALIETKQFHTLHDLQQYFTSYGMSPHLKENLSIKNSDISELLYHTLLPAYFHTPSRFTQQFNHYKIFFNFFQSCKSLHMYNLKSIRQIVKNKTLIEKLYVSKIKKLTYKDDKDRITITQKDIDKEIKRLAQSDPPTIVPILITTLSVGSFAKYFLIVLMRRTKSTLQKIDQLRPYFPRTICGIGFDIRSTEYIISVQIWMHTMTSEEKMLFISLFYNIFHDDLISIRSVFFDGLFDPYSRKHFFDFERSQFFYTRDLFDQYRKYTRALFGKNLPDVYFCADHENESLFWRKDITDIQQIEEKVADRVFREQIVFDSTKGKRLKEFHLDLCSILQDNQTVNMFKNKEFFTQYIDHIYFIPQYQAFGYSWYFLYILPADLGEIDFPLFLSNIFLNVKYPAYIDRSKSFLVQYLFPYRAPNTSYFNWLIDSKRAINEYCLCRVKRIHQIFHFDYNLSSNGWDLNPLRFKSYLQNVLFNPRYHVKPSYIKTYDVDSVSPSIFGPDSEEYEALTQLYDYPSGLKDLKTILMNNYPNIIDNVEHLLRSGLIFPYTVLKNLGLIQTLTIIIPEINNKTLPKLIRIFSFFNFGFFYEVQSTHYIKGYTERKRSETGAIIEIRLPDCDLGEFISLFNDLFRYLEIDHYLILSDMVQGSPLLEHLYDDDTIEEYNPFKNLEWNKKDNIWMNVKLFDENFSKLYPKMVPDKQGERNS